jgi:hypothetical protein
MTGLIAGYYSGVPGRTCFPRKVRIVRIASISYVEEVLTCLSRSSNIEGFPLQVTFP